MDPILEMADKLGKAIAVSPQDTTLREARKELDKHADILQLLKDFRAQADKVAQLESEQKPVEVDDKHKYEELHGKLIASDVFKKYTAAQVEFVDLMRKVNGSLRRQLAQLDAQ